MMPILINYKLCYVLAIVDCNKLVQYHQDYGDGNIQNADTAQQSSSERVFFLLIENRVCSSSIGRSIDACTQEGVVVWYRFGPKESDLILWHSGKHVHDIMPVKTKSLP